MPFELSPYADSQDAYVSMVEADDLLARVADITAWTAATEQRRAAALMQASDEIDSQKYDGYKYLYFQVREFPRVNIADACDWNNFVREMTQGKDGSALAIFLPDYGHRFGYGFGGNIVWEIDRQSGAVIIPPRVKMATLHQALTLLRDPQRINRLRDQADNVASQSAAGFSESYDTSKKVNLLCFEARELLRPYFFKTGTVI